MEIRIYGRFDSMTPDSVATRDAGEKTWSVWRDGFYTKRQLADDDFIEGTYAEFDYTDGDSVTDVIDGNGDGETEPTLIALATEQNELLARFLIDVCDADDDREVVE